MDAVARALCDVEFLRMMLACGILIVMTLVHFWDPVTRGRNAFKFRS
jgi:hypothetical protein